MPNINLRLTSEEHEALRKWAYEGQRSLQREIIFRLFNGRHVTAGLSEGSEVEDKRTVPAPRSTGTAQTHGTATELPGVASPSASSDAHFKPDFK
jgi:hypothetical protein